MQILHAGCKVRGESSERLTMVTSYEAKDWSLPNWNDGLLGGVRVVRERITNTWIGDDDDFYSYHSGRTVALNLSYDTDIMNSESI